MLGVVSSAPESGSLGLELAWDDSVVELPGCYQ